MQNHPRLSPDDEVKESFKCEQSPAYFIHNYCMVEDKSPDVLAWIPFRLWPAQRTVLGQILSSLLTIILKARQLGLSWLVLGYALWLLLFRPGSQILMFSRRDDEAKELLERLKGMHEHLPPFLQAKIGENNDHTLEFSKLNSVAKSFPTTKDSGRSYTATLVIIDEADFILWLKQLITAVKPTIDGGGQLIMISTSNKELPQSEFKRLWKAGHAKLNRYLAVFLPWSARPGRTQEWYQNQVDDYEEDDLHQEYPATPAQALAPRSASMRFQPAWIEAISDVLPHIEIAEAPALPGLVVYERPEALKTYLVSVDTSEGDPTSDPSPATVFCVETWEEVAHIYGRFEPIMLSDYVVQLAKFYSTSAGTAVICIERNNHGHAVQAALELREDYRELNVYVSPFDKKHGWLSSLKQKTLAMNNAASVFKEGGCKIRTEASLIELALVEASTLKAIEGETDDRAMSIIIGLAALRWPGVRPSGGLSTQY